MGTKLNILKQFDLKLFNLKDKIYDFSYSADNEFFEQFEYSPAKAGNCEVKVTLNKSDLLLQFDFEIRGTVELACDRSLELFDFPIDKKAKILLKYGESYEELSDDLIIIEKDTMELNLAQWVYELIVVEIPYKKLHPKFVTEDDDFDDFDDYEEDSDLELVYSDVSEDEEETSEEESGELWEELKKKFNKE